jgi:hypothetical protein
MIGRVIIACALLSLGACAAYGEGEASYDAVKRASDDCKARGGTLQLKADGDSQKISDFECKMGKGA